MTRAASASRIIASSRPTRSALSTTPPGPSRTTSIASSRPRATFTHHLRRHFRNLRAPNLPPGPCAQEKKYVQRRRPSHRRTTRPRPPARTTPAAQQDARGRPAPGRRLHALPRHGYSTPSSPTRKTSPLTHTRRIRVHRPRRLQLPVGPLAAAAGACADTGEQVAAGLAGAEGVDNGVGGDAGGAGGVSAG